MVVYRLRADPNYQGIVPCLAKDWELLGELRGQPVRSWNSLQVRVPAEERNLLPGDCPSLATHVPVFSKRARTVLAPVLDGRGDFLELTLDGEQYWAFNVTDVRDALDEEHSVVKRFRHGGIMDVVRHAFTPSVLEGATIFKICGLEVMDVFVSNSFVERAHDGGLVGFRFDPVWSGAG